MVGFAVFASSGGFARGWLVPRGGMGVGDPPTLRANDEHEDWRTPSLNNVKLGTKKNIWETNGAALHCRTFNNKVKKTPGFMTTPPGYEGRVCLYPGNTFEESECRD